MEEEICMPICIQNFITNRIIIHVLEFFFPFYVYALPFKTKHGYSCYQIPYTILYLAFHTDHYNNYFLLFHDLKVISQNEIE